MIDRKIIDDIKAATDIVAKIGSYVSLKRAGPNYKCICPFHSEKTPSLMVSPRKGVYKCFGCGAGGDVIDFVKRIESTTFYDAVIMLANDSGINVDIGEDEKRRYERKKKLYSFNESINKDFVSSLNKESIDWLGSKGISDKSIERFGIGYCKPDYYVKANKDSGLFNSKGNLYLLDRITFPIFDRAGIIGFGGRSLKADPKYINPGDTEFYDKSCVLYNYNNARASAIKKNNMFVVEGYTDVIALDQAGVNNVIATCGTSLTQNHARQIRMTCDNVTIMYDGDDAGRKGSMRALENLLKEGLNVYRVELPNGYDPCDLCCDKEYNAVQYIIKNRCDFVTGIVDKCYEMEPATATSLINNVESMLKLMPYIKRQVYCSYIYKKLNVKIIDGKEKETIRNSNNVSIEERLKSAIIAFWGLEYLDCTVEECIVDYFNSVGKVDGIISYAIECIESGDTPDFVGRYGDFASGAMLTLDEGDYITYMNYYYGKAITDRFDEMIKDLINNRGYDDNTKVKLVSKLIKNKTTFTKKINDD